MKNEEVILAFINEKPGFGLHLLSYGDKLFSYYTCIAQRIDGKIIVNRTNYSPTTSKHVSMLLRNLDVIPHFVYEIYKGTTNLKPYYYGI